MEAVLDNLLAVLPPLVTVVQHIQVAPGLEAEPGFPHLPPHLHPSFLPRRRWALPPAHLINNRCRYSPNQFVSARTTPRPALQTLTFGQPHYSTIAPKRARINNNKWVMVRSYVPIAGTWAVACGGGTSDLGGGFRH